MFRYILFFFVLNCALAVQAHEDTAYGSVKTSQIKNAKPVSEYLHVYVDTFRKQQVNDLSTGMFQHLYELKNKVVQKKYMVDGQLYLLFWIFNDLPETKRYYFSAGTFSKNTHFFTRSSSDSPWRAMPYELPVDGQLCYRKIELKPLKEVQLLVQTNFAKTTVSQMFSYLIDEQFYKYYINFQHTQWHGLHVITYTISGILLMMLLFSFFTYLQNKRKQFLYYSIYALCVFLMLFLKAIFHEASTAINFFNEEYLDYALLIIGYIFYIGFTRMFLNTPKDYPILNKIFVVAELILGVFLALFTWMYFTGKSFLWLDTTENISKYFMIFLGIVYIVIGITRRNKLMNYLLAGNVANLLFAAISQVIIVVRFASFIPTTGLFRQSLLYFEIGIFIELVFFLLGLIYKNKIELIEKTQMDAFIKQEKERQEYEKEIAVLRAQQEERIRISADMHDELGSGVTAIRLLSEIALQKTKEQPIEEIKRISFNANELMSKMNGIIWSMNPGNDTLGSSIAYIRSYASEYLDNFKINYTINVPQVIPEIELSGNKRRNLFLVIKESLNNIIKHANAEKVIIDFDCTNGLTISIYDDGKGLNNEKLNEFGNGLKNMQRRMQNIGGSFIITSFNGTTVQLQLPLTK